MTAPGSFNPHLPNGLDALDARCEEGIGLCLSGGGYRAMLFHVGSLWRLNEGGILSRLDRVSSVSGGSITAAVLGAAWPRLAFDSAGISPGFEAEVVDPLRRLASRTVDVRAALGGLLGWRSVASCVAYAYRRYLFGNATLQDFPDVPRFVLNATNVQTGALWRFSKPYMGDYRVGLTSQPDVPLAVAVSASSGFPPILSPLRLALDRYQFVDTPGADLQRPPYTSYAVLTDGGVYDNLGLETVWKRYRTVLVSDAGGLLAEEARPGRDWLRHSLRVSAVVDHQVRNLRKRQLLHGFSSGARRGTYWGIRSDVTELGVVDGLPCPPGRTHVLASIGTRLAALPRVLQERLINWGYAASDAALRRNVPELGLAAPSSFPYPAAGV